MASNSNTVYDYVVFAVFIVASSSVAIYSRFSGPKERTKAEYVFATGGSVSMAAMMLSIARGTLGVRSFLGYPSELYYRGSAMWETLYGMILAYPIVCFVFVPVYYNLGITSVYQYLDLRFKSRLVRCLASLTYVIRSLLNLGVTVFTPCVALKTVIGLPYWASIFGITFISVIFTVMTLSPFDQLNRSSALHTSYGSDTGPQTNTQDSQPPGEGGGISLIELESFNTGLSTWGELGVQYFCYLNCVRAATLRNLLSSFLQRTIWKRVLSLGMCCYRRELQLALPSAKGRNLAQEAQRDSHKVVFLVFPCLCIRPTDVLLSDEDNLQETGGLKAAILADVMQGLTMIFCSVVIIIQGTLNVGVSAVINVPRDEGRLKFFDFNTDPTIRVTTLSALFGQLFMSLSIFGCQQNFVQRYCSMKSQKTVTHTLLANIPVITVLFSLSWVAGMVIFANYVNCDPLSLGYINKIDEIVPFFVEDQFTYLPGFLGLFMASLFNGALRVPGSLYGQPLQWSSQVGYTLHSIVGFLGLFMASLFNGALSLAVSNLNSLATVTWEDFISQIPQFKHFTDRQQLLTIKTIGCIYGLVIMGVSFGVGLLSGVIESSMLMTSATSGPLLGVFVLAMLFPCANWKGASSGMIIGHVITLWITFGGLTVDKAPVTMLPLSVDGCTNDSYSHIMAAASPLIYAQSPVEWNNHSLAEYPLYVYNLTQEVLEDQPEVVTAVSENPLDVLSKMYSITYMYYSLIGCGITLFVGILVSYMTGTNEDDAYDVKLIHPMALRISSWFPGRQRKYVSDRITSPEKHRESSVVPETLHVHNEQKTNVKPHPCEFPSEGRYRVLQEPFTIYTTEKCLA
uniref:Sodium-coupled monocarboxylate transporter 1 n=1 Tax=Timema bartmani TaxID=61472 RepID=A0A7R9FBJ0_9NEOP|nr:unnamed protein product [Timema bartmani]